MLLCIIQSAVIYGRPWGPYEGTSYNRSPQITNFNATPGPFNTWTFDGVVVDENPGGLTVWLGGLINATCLTQADGSFSHTVTIPPPAAGLVTARTKDAQGLDSNIAMEFISTY
jgi:hypothetical protein